MLTEEQKQAILDESAIGYFQSPAWRLPGPHKKYTTAQRKKRKAVLQATARSRAKSRPKKLSRRKKRRKKGE